MFLCSFPPFDDHICRSRSDGTDGTSVRDVVPDISLAHLQLASDVPHHMCHDVLPQITGEKSMCNEDVQCAMNAISFVQYVQQPSMKCGL